MAYKLHAYKNSINLLKIKAIAKLAKVELEVVEVENLLKPQPVVEQSPTNSIPYLETPEGVISESNAIVSFIGAKGGLAGSNDFERSQIAQWLFFANQEIAYNKKANVYSIFGFVEFDEKENKESLDKLKNHLKALNKHLTGKEYLVGSSLTIADLELFVQLKHLLQLVYVDAVRKNLFSAVEAWFLRVAQNQTIVSVFGITHLAKVAIKAPRVEKKVEKKEEKKVEKVEKKEEKPVKPLFPETKMDFDQFKKDFSNTENKKEILDKFFAEQYDKDAFSIYRIKYQKLESEGQLLWKTENAMSFFLQKIDSNRKHAFANHGVFGEEGSLDIKGVWMWRGVGIPFFMEDHESFEFYDRAVLDPFKAEDRKLIDEFWTAKVGDMVEGQKAQILESFK